MGGGAAGWKAGKMPALPGGEGKGSFFIPSWEGCGLPARTPAFGQVKNPGPSRRARCLRFPGEEKK